MRRALRADDKAPRADWWACKRAVGLSARACGQLRGPGGRAGGRLAGRRTEIGRASEGERAIKRVEQAVSGQEIGR